MTSASLFGLLNFDTPWEDVSSRKRRQHRLPVPLAVEQLEDRTVPDAAAVNFNGPLNVAAANFSPGPTVQFAPFLTATPVFVAGASYIAWSNQNLPLLTISGVNSVGTSAELYELFGLNAVNSSGQANPLTRRSWQADAFGFGSGTQPGEPWAPAYMNVGLANQQGQAQNLPWGRTITYGQGAGTRNDGGNQAAPRAGGGGAAPQPGDANRPDQKNQPNNAPKQKQEGDKQDKKEAAPKKADQNRDQKKAPPKQKDQENKQPQGSEKKEQPPGDEPEGINGPRGQLLPGRSEEIPGINSKERMATIDRILSDQRDEKDGTILDGVALSDPAVLSSSLLLASASVHSGPLAAILPAGANQSAADEGFAGSSDSGSTDGSD